MRKRVGLGMMSAWVAAVGVSSAATVSWDGGPDGTGTNWNEATNWNGDALPGGGDVARFANEGLAAGRVITLGAEQVGRALQLDSTLNFTIGDAAGNTAGHTLTVGGASRSEGSSGTHAIVADLLLSGEVVWDVNGAGSVNLNKLSGSGTLRKQGAGELRLNGTTSSRTGATIISQGTLSVSNEKQLGSGNLVVGNGVDVATFLSRWNSTWNIDLIGNSAAVLVKSNGVFDTETAYTQSSGRTDTIGSMAVEAGGVAKLGKWGFNMTSLTGTNVTLSGGTVTSQSGGYLGPVSGTILVQSETPVMSTLACDVRVSYKYSGGALFTRFNVHDVAGVPVDLLVSGAINNIWDDRDGFDKVGGGVMQVTANNTYGGRSTAEGATRIQAGTLLVDNTEGSGTGKSFVSVAAGATLGGRGFVGGVAGYGVANVSVGGSAGNPAVVAPGSIDRGTGAHLVGTLTVGNLAAQTNNVTFGANSKLRLTIDAAGNGDRLVVNGTLSLATATDTLELDVADADALPGGVYTLVTFQQLAAPGQIFETVAGLPSRGVLVYSANAIEYHITPKGTIISVR